MDASTNTNDADTDADDVSPGRGNRGAKAGVVLMAIGMGLWVALLLVPFLSLSVAARAGIAGGLVIVAEVVFWVGAVLAGPTAARRMRSWWRRSNTASPPGQ